MPALELFVKGLLAGLIISIPVGPVNILVVHKTLAQGCRAGFRAGIGAALADTIYGAIAGFSISLVIGFLVREEFWIRVIGGCLLIGIGVWYYGRRSPRLENKDVRRSKSSDAAATFFLNLTNPTTVMSFLVVLAVLGLGGPRPSLLSLVVVGGIFAGSMVWWIALSLAVDYYRDRFSDRVIGSLNRVAGLAIGGFGMLMIALGLEHGL